MEGGFSCQWPPIIIDEGVNGLPSRWTVALPKARLGALEAGQSKRCGFVVKEGTTVHFWSFIHRLSAIHPFVLKSLRTDNSEAFFCIGLLFATAAIQGHSEKEEKGESGPLGISGRGDL